MIPILHEILCRRSGVQTRAISAVMLTVADGHKLPSNIYFNNLPVILSDVWAIYPQLIGA